MKKILITLIWLTTFISSATVAQEKSLFAGFAFTGAYENREQLYPYSSMIINQKLSNGQSVLDAEFLRRLKSRPAEFSRITTELGQLGKGEQISIAFAVNSEEVEYQNINNELSVLIRIYASVLAFDRETHSLTASYPFVVGTTIEVPHKLNRQELQKVFMKLYLTNEFGINAFDSWIDRFSLSVITKKYSKYLQVKSVNFENEAMQTISSLENGSEKVLMNKIGNALDASISEATNVPIIPSIAGEAVGSKMAYRFSNGSALQLNLPQPDFEITFTIRAFRSVVAEEDQAKVAIFRTLATVKIEQPDLNNVYLNEKIYSTLYIRVPGDTRITIDEWSQFNKSLLDLITGLAGQFNKVEKTWLEESASNGSDAFKSFENASGLFASLRTTHQDR